MIEAALARIGVTRLALIAYAVAAVTLILDQLSKAWILYGLHLPEVEQIRLLPILNLTMVWNPGISFSLFRAENLAGRIALAIFALAVVVSLAVWARRATRPLTALAIGMIMGGAVGNNLFDRLRLGRVVDFIDVSGLGFFPWVFNVADSAICIGVGLLLLESFLSERQPAATPKP